MTAVRGSRFQSRVINILRRPMQIHKKRAINEVQQSFEVVCEITISKERRREAGQEENEKLVKLFF